MANICHTDYPKRIDIASIAGSGRQSIKKLKKIKLAQINLDIAALPTLLSRSEMTFTPATENERIFIEEASMVQRQLLAFVEDSPNAEFISLGQNCSSAWYLQQTGLKKRSYPFDWIFSSPQITLDCINDGFLKFLDKSLLIEKPNGASAGHAHYHASLFNHRNPAGSDNDYNYYKRCCDRFHTAIRGNGNIVFLITLINEPDKRPGWATGFTQAFPMPKHQDIESIQELMDAIWRLHNNAKFVVVDHYTHQCRRAAFERINEKVFFLKYQASGDSNGIHYRDPLDDYCFKRIISGLSNNA